MCKRYVMRLHSRQGESEGGREKYERLTRTQTAIIAQNEHITMQKNSD